MAELLAVIDTETSGLSNPHLLQLACRMVDDRRRYVGGFSYIIQPTGWGIEADAEAIHGISEAYAYKVGMHPTDALESLYWIVERCNKVIGFNIQGFDRGVIRQAIVDTGEQPWWWDQCSNKMVDVMELATPVMQLAGRFDGYKHPSLEEAVQYFLGNEWDVVLDLAEQEARRWKSSHRADEDALMTERVYWAIKNWKL